MMEIKCVYNRNLNEMDFANPENIVLFDSSEEAWLWFCKYSGRRDGYKRESSANIVFRPCSLDDVYIVVSRLYLSGKITKKQLEVLLKYGEKQIIPDDRIFDEYEDAVLWRDAMKKMEALFMKKKIIKDRNVEGFV